MTTTTLNKRVPTSPGTTARINAMFDANADQLGYLHSRWADESEYEDWSEYAALMKCMAPEGFTVTRTSKRPFGFEFTVTDAPEGALYAMRASTRGVEWMRLK